MRMRGIYSYQIGGIRSVEMLQRDVFSDCSCPIPDELVVILPESFSSGIQDVAHEIVHGLVESLDWPQIVWKRLFLIRGASRVFLDGEEVVDFGAFGIAFGSFHHLEGAEEKEKCMFPDKSR